MLLSNAKKQQSITFRSRSRSLSLSLSLPPRSAAIQWGDGKREGQPLKISNPPPGKQPNLDTCEFQFSHHFLLLCKILLHTVFRYLFCCPKSQRGKEKENEKIGHFGLPILVKELICFLELENQE